MPKHIIYAIFGLLVGLAIGFFVANAINKTTNDVTAASSNSKTTQPQPMTIGTPTGGMQADVAETLKKADAEPQNFAVQMETGDMYGKIGKFDKAIEYYKRGLAINPNDFNANVVLGNAFFDTGQFEEAELAYTKALLINPKDVNVRTDLGTTFVERKVPNYDRAIKEFKEALQLSPENEPTLYYLGIAYWRKGDVENANKALTDLEKKRPNSELIGRLRQNMEAK